MSSTQHCLLFLTKLGLFARFEFTSCAVLAIHNNMHSPNVKPNLVDALAQLEIGGQSRPRSFNKLPNELLRAILRRVQAHHLIRLRLVDNRWRAQIEDIWKGKKCLMIGQLRDKDYLPKFCAKFNGKLKLTTDFVFIHLNRRDYHITLSGHLCTLLPKLFPNIEQFYIFEYVKYPSTEVVSMLNQWSSTLSTLSLSVFQNQNPDDLYAQLNQMTNLKRLDLAFFPFMKELSPTFARLEHFSTRDYNAIDKIVPFFGEGFCSLGFHCGYVDIKLITNWSRLNAQFVRNLVRLSLIAFDSQVLPFICGHFSSLQMLRIDVDGCQFTTEMIANLARLTHLSELRIDGTKIDLATLDVAKLKPLPNIRIFSLVDFKFVIGGRVQRTLPANYDVPLFSRILSTILPNVTKLTVKSEKYPEIGNLLKTHLNQFAHLRSFNVELDSSIGRLMN